MILEPWEEKNKIKRFFKGLFYNNRYAIIGVPIFVILFLLIVSGVQGSLGVTNSSLNQGLVWFPWLICFFGLASAPFIEKLKSRLILLLIVIFVGWVSLEVIFPIIFGINFYESGGLHNFFKNIEGSLKSPMFFFYGLGLTSIISIITLIFSLYSPWLPKNEDEDYKMRLKTQWLTNLIGSPWKKMMPTYSEQELKEVYLNSLLFGLNLFVILWFFKSFTLPVYYFLF